MRHVKSDIHYLCDGFITFFHCYEMCMLRLGYVYAYIIIRSMPFVASVLCTFTEVNLLAR